MTTRLEIEHAVFNKGRITASRQTLLELEDRRGIHRTEFGDVQLDVRQQQHTYGWNTDIILDFRQSIDLQKKVRAGVRRISVKKGAGRGSQQIGDGVTLFVSTDISKPSPQLYREKYPLSNG